MKKIEKKITSFEVKQKPKNVESISPPTDILPIQMHESLERPDLLLGSTYKIKTPMSDHALYITINDILLNEGTKHEQRRPFEIFINSKNMENFQWIIALTRVISGVFRKGGDCTFLVDELQAVFDPKGGYFKKGGKFMPSLVSEIGETIERHMKMIGLISIEKDEHTLAFLTEKRKELTTKEESENSDFPSAAILCYKCNTKAVILMDGCYTCLNCGESKCGT